MESLIRYVATECRYEIESYTQYVKDICSRLESRGMISYMLSEPSCTKKVAQLPDSGGRRISYEIMYSIAICGISYTWYIDMDFFERQTGTELRININSKTYLLGIEDGYMLKLQQVIEDCIGSDWGTFVRIVDVYSDMLNTLLYPDLHRVENSCRRLVSGIMTNVYGAMWHGLPLDLSLAGYLTAIPGILLIASAWTNSSILRRIRQGYFGVIAFVMACLFIIDLGLYGFWGFRLDATPIFYFFSSPKDAMASVSFWFVLLGILAILIYAAILYCIFYCVLIREKKPLKIPYRRQNVSLALLLLTAALFIPIRGGFSVSTMNLSKVYFSQDQRMNHAAINPAFSFMYSATHQNNFDKQYRFMDPKIADELFAMVAHVWRAA